MRKISLFAVCPECGAALRPEACWSCDGTAASWISTCEECSGTGQLLLCPNWACHSPRPPNQETSAYWRGSEGQFSNPFYCNGASTQADPEKRRMVSMNWATATGFDK